MRRLVLAITVSPETQQKLESITQKAGSDSALVTRLGLINSDTPAAPVVDSDGLSTENYAVITKELGGGVPVTKNNLTERLNSRLQHGGESRVREVLYYIKKARRDNSKAVRSAAHAARTVVNLSRVAEALIIIGAESLGNAVSERSSKSGFGQSSYDGKAARKSTNTKTRKAHAASTHNGKSGVAA